MCTPRHDDLLQDRSSWRVCNLGVSLLSLHSTRTVQGADDKPVSDTHTEMAMGMERTFSIVKPDAVARNLIGEIYSRFEKGGLRIVALRSGQRRRTGNYQVQSPMPGKRRSLC